jgi:membrane protein
VPDVSSADDAKATAKKLSERVRDHNLTLVAAGVAFYAFLALVPALIAFVSIYGLVANPSDVTRQVKNLGSALPNQVQNFLVYQLTQIVNANNAGLSIVTVVAILLAVWSASSGIAALVTGIHIARERKQPKGFVAKRRKALLLTLAAIIFLSVVLFVIVAVPPLVSGAFGNVGRVVFEVLR